MRFYVQLIMNVNGYVCLSFANASRKYELVLTSVCQCTDIIIVQPVLYY